MFFYELHEGDDEVYSDVILYSDSEWEPDEFFDLVQSVRRRVQDSYPQDTLIEAIATVLEREHGFLFVRRAQQFMSPSLVGKRMLEYGHTLGHVFDGGK